MPSFMTKLALAMALMAASITQANAQYAISSDGTMRLDAAAALSQNYADIMNARLAASSSSQMSSDNSSSSLADLTGVSSKASAADVSATSEVPLNADGTIDIDAWNNSTEVACQKALAGISIASNPSGTGICYNLPALNTSSGIFQADLRLYKLSTASGDFAGVASSNIQVQLSYGGASVSSVNTTANSTTTSAKLKTRELDELNQRDLELHRRENGVPMLKQYMLVGQIDASKMSNNMSMASLEALVMPTLTLSALANTGQVTTNVSSNEAVFVNGVFSREVVMSDLQVATLAVNAIHAELANGTVAFVLPGVRLMTSPVGLVITSIWLGLGLIAYGIGTYDRFMYATSYRRQIAAIQGSGKQTF